MRHPLNLRYRKKLYQTVVTGERDDLVVRFDDEEEVSLSIFPLGDGVVEARKGGGRRLVHYAVDGDVVHLQDGGHVFSFRQERHEGAGADQDGGSDDLGAPMPGKVTRIFVEAGQSVEAGASLYALEAMKMETIIRAPEAGTVATVLVEVGAQVDGGAQIVTLVSGGEAGEGE